MSAVLVTGASRGIGRAVAMAFAEAGDRVAIHHRRTGELAKALLASLPGDGHTVVQADIADPDETRRMVDEAAEALAGIDILVNNAGVYVEHPIMESSYEEWRAVWRTTLDVNLVGTANVTWCAVQHMPSGGKIINVSSRGAFRGEPTAPAYGASKAGMNALGQSLAVALAPRGISVATVAPGWVETDMTNEHLKQPRGEAIRAQSPFGRVARPEEIASAVRYLASPDAEWATGAILDLNGASHLRT